MSYNNRKNFATSSDIPNYPDFLDIQVKSFKDFFQLETKSDERSDEGLYKTFLENFPISDARNQFVLEFIDYFVDPPGILRFKRIMEHKEKNNDNKGRSRVIS